MKALTICQPYPALILLPVTDPRHKRVENRTWPTNYRGPMYMHAGKSRAWLQLSEDGTRDEMYEIPLSSMPFGAVVATMDLLDCLRIERIRSGEYGRQYPWLREHIHASGPWCWVLGNIKPMNPRAWRGAQGLFDIDPAELTRGAA
jgi:activating signal cointegrator 1